MKKRAYHESWSRVQHPCYVYAIDLKMNKIQAEVLHCGEEKISAFACIEMFRYDSTRDLLVDQDELHH